MRLWLVFLGLLPILLVGSGPGAGANTPALPPQNGLIAVHGNDGLYLVDPASGSAVLVSGTEASEDEVWSPDGTRLALTLWGQDGETPAVYTMNPNGSDRALVARNATSPSWSPDGDSLVVVRQGFSELGEGGTQLVLAAADGSQERLLLPKAGAPPTFLSSPAWSPDGNVIAFVGEDGRIELVTQDGEKLDGFEANVSKMGLSWSPDSSRLAFNRYLESKGESHDVVVVLDIATGKETVLSGEQQGAQAPEWSPEGDQIAFLSMRLRETQPATTGHSCGGEPYDTHLWSMRPDGTKAHRLVKGEFYSRPSWGLAAEVASAPASVPSETR